jgi:hypothetical protein
MLTKWKTLLAFSCLAPLLAACGSTPEPADLSQVLDRTVAALEHVDKQVEGEKASDEQMTEFTSIMAKVMNQEPRFYDAPIGVTLLADATFEGYRDENANSTMDSGEKRIFTVEIDAEKERLIATDEAGQSTDFRAAGMGFLAGALIGNMLGRQRSSGMKSGHFNSRNVSPRSSYSNARTSARSGSFSSGK